VLYQTPHSDMRIYFRDVTFEFKVFRNHWDHCVVCCKH